MDHLEHNFFSCEKCDSTFVTKRSLESHCKAFHSQQQNTKVNIIPRRISHPPPRELNKNQTREEKVIIFKKEQERPTTTTTSKVSPTKLNTQLEYLEGVKKGKATFPCRLCNRDFTQGNQLTQHLNTVHSEVTITRTRFDSPSSHKTPKPRTSLLKRPLERREADALSSKRLDSNVNEVSESQSTNTSSHLQLGANFEITDVVRSLLISHMNAETGREEAKKIILNIPQPETASFKSSSPSNLVPFGNENESEDDDEFEGEGSELSCDGTNDLALVPLVSLEQEDEDMGNYSCAECGALFHTSCKLESHMEHHNNNTSRPYKCRLCGDSRGFVRKEHLTKHMSSVHSGMKFTCEFCGKDISRRDHLVRHIRTVHRCPIPPGLDLITTNLQIPTNVAATQMEIDEMSDKAFQSMQPKPRKPYTKCDMCDEMFTQLDTLFQHQREAHGDIRKYNCEMCPKSFKRREHLQKHIVLHTGEKKFSCENCARSFPRRDALQDHLRRIHGTQHTTDTEEFPCSLCDKVFLQHSNLVRHRNQVHNITLALSIANNGPINESDTEDQEDGMESMTGKQRRPPIPGLLPIQNFYFQPTSLRNN